MNDDYDDMNCCSEYFYIRYAGENTLIGKFNVHHRVFYKIFLSIEKEYFVYTII